MGLWETIRSWLTHPLVAGPLVGFVVVGLAYLDSKFRDKKRERDTYLKLFAVTSLVSAIIVYLVVEEYEKVDEFLTQNYDTDVPDIMPSRGGGYEQPEMVGPPDAARILEGLSVPHRPSRVEMVSERLHIPRHRSSRHSGGRHRSSRHGRHHRH